MTDQFDCNDEGLMNLYNDSFNMNNETTPKPGASIQVIHSHPGDPFAYSPPNSPVYPPHTDCSNPAQKPPSLNTVFDTGLPESLSSGSPVGAPAHMFSTLSSADSPRQTQTFSSSSAKETHTLSSSSTAETHTLSSSTQNSPHQPGSLLPDSPLETDYGSSSPSTSPPTPPRNAARSPATFKSDRSTATFTSTSKPPSTNHRNRTVSKRRYIRPNQAQPHPAYSPYPNTFGAFIMAPLMVVASPAMFGQNWGFPMQRQNMMMPNGQNMMMPNGQNMMMPNMMMPNIMGQNMMMQNPSMIRGVQSETSTSVPSTPQNFLTRKLQFDEMEDHIRGEEAKQMYALLQNYPNSMLQTLRRTELEYHNKLQRERSDQQSASKRNQMKQRQKKLVTFLFLFGTITPTQQALNNQPPLSTTRPIKKLALYELFRMCDHSPDGNSVFWRRVTTIFKGKRFKNRTLGGNRVFSGVRYLDTQNPHELKLIKAVYERIHKNYYPLAISKQEFINRLRILHEASAPPSSSSGLAGSPSMYSSSATPSPVQYCNSQPTTPMSQALVNQHQFFSPPDQ